MAVMKHLKYLVTGTGRCGTVYMARFLTSLNIPCGHESIFDSSGIEVAVDRLLGKKPISLSEISQFNCNAPNWINPEDIVAESSYMAAPFLNHECLKNTFIIHVVRHPVRVVNSFCNYHGYFMGRKPGESTRCNLWERFIYKHIPELQEELTQYDRACLYYVYWNSMIENQLLNRGYFFHRIEDDTSKLFEILEMEPVGDAFDNKTINTLKKPATKSFRINSIENKDIKDLFVNMGERYGYNMSSEYLLI